ncbi:MAG: aminotransferase class IV [Planctomycetota bacterium]|jgi:D-amino acid aminotransferase
MAEKVFLNDKLVDIDKAGISISDSGFLYGVGLFETMRSHEGTVFALSDHLDRLFNSAKVLSINNSYEKDFIEKAIDELLAANKLTEARLRLTLTGGPISSPDEVPKSTLLITATQLQPCPPEYYNNGALVVLCPYRQNVNDPTCGHKTINYFLRMHGLDFARQRRALEALWFTTDNRLAEGSISNVFIVKDSAVYTPKTNTPVLPGIARKYVCKLAGENSVELVEKDLGIDELLEADEVFLTNMIMKIMPVSRIEKHVVDKDGVGPITKRLQKHLDEFILTSTEREK